VGVLCGTAEAGLIGAQAVDPLQMADGMSSGWGGERSDLGIVVLLYR
jgi:hypothetical protein